MRKRHSATFKAKVALEAIRERETMAELSSKHHVSRTQIQQWKKQAIEGISKGLEKKGTGDNRFKEQQEAMNELYPQIGQLKVENDWLKKKYEEFNG